MKNPIHPLLLAAVSMVLPSSPALAAPQGAPKPVTTVEGITQYRLENGLEVLLLPDPGKPLITVNITYRVGSRHENYGETGMAHLLEHLLFKGTPRHKNIPSELTKHGARANGTTYFDRTNYYETFDATEENLRWALELESDRMVNSFVARKDLDSEMTVVRNEFEIGENTPSRILYQRVLSTAFLWHNYGKSTIGARSDIENVNIDRLQAFYRNYYQPDNATLLVAGDFDPTKTLRLITETFGKIPRPKRALQSTYTLDPTQDGERNVVLRRVGDVQLVGAAYHIPAASHPDSAAVEVLSWVLGNTPRGKLYQALVERKLATSVGGHSQSLREPGVIYFSAEVRKDQALQEVADRLTETVEGLAASPGLTAEDIEKAKNRMLKDIELEMNAIDQFGVHLSEAVAAGDWRLYFLGRDALKKVTLEDVKRVAGAYLKSSNRTLGLFYPTAKPERAEIPKTPEIEALVREYRGDTAASRGENFDTDPMKIEKRIRRAATENGLKMAFLEKKTRGSTVKAVLNLRFGDEKSLTGLSTVGRLTARMLMRGTQKHSRQQIQDELDRLKADVAVGGGAEGVTVSIETVRENLPEVVKLVSEILREPAFPEAEFERMRQEDLAFYEQKRTDPAAVANLEMSRHLLPRAKEHPLYAQTFDEAVAELNGIKPGSLRDFHRGFYGASFGELAVVGDFDSAAVQKMVESLLGSWKSPGIYHRITRSRPEVTPATRTVQIPDKANAAFIAGMTFELSEDHPDYPAIALSNFMLGGGFLNSRFATRIRQKEGLSYNVRSSLSADPSDALAIFQVFATCAPQNAKRLETAFREEMARALAEGFTTEELEEAKSGVLRSMKVSRSQDDELASRLTNRLHFGRTLVFDADLEAKIRALKKEDVLAALKRHLSLERFSRIEAGTLPESNRPN